MANRLKMANVNAILQLRERGWSFRRIARGLGVRRDTVSRYRNPLDKLVACGIIWSL